MKKFFKVATLIFAVCILSVAFMACGDNAGSGGITVTFDYNYENSPAAEKVTVNSGEAVTPPDDPTRVKYKFIGWYTDAECTEEADFEFAITENVTYYAAWEQTVATITFVYNNGSSTNGTEDVEIGNALMQPEDPKYDGHVFTSWYTDAALTSVYDFTSSVTGDMTLYAGWDEINTEGALDLVYMWNYEDAPDNGIAYTTQVNYNSKPRKYTAVRDGYYLEGWYTDPSCTQPFDFGARMTADVTLYARWMDIYTFEAEYVDFTGMSGNGYSGSMSGVGLIVKQKAENQNASNGHYAGWAYKEGYTLTFEIESDTAVDDAVIVLRLSAEFYNMTYTSDKYLVQVNGTNLDYDPISITGVPAQGTNEWKAFSNFTISTTVSLQAGENTIKLIVNNSDRLGDSGTMYATAPLVDCMYIYTDATLSWNPLTDNLNGKIS